MFKNLKKYRKIIFMLMIIFISSFLGTNKVEAATALKSGNCVINSAGEYYLSESYTCKYFYINTSNVTLDLNGKTLTVNEQLKVAYNLKDIFIKDSKGSGVVQSKNSTQSKYKMNNPTIFVTNSATLYIEGGSYYNKSNLSGVFGIDGHLIFYDGYVEANVSDNGLGVEANKNRQPIFNIAVYNSEATASHLYCLYKGRVSIYGGTIINNLDNVAAIGSNSKCQTNDRAVVIRAIRNVPTIKTKILYTTKKGIVDTTESSFKIYVYNDSSDITYSYGETFNLSDRHTPKVITGKMFEGYYLDENYTTEITKVDSATAGDFTVYPKYVEATYNINYYNGNTKLTGLTPTTYGYGETVTLPTYSVNGYTFGGWYTDTNYTTKVTTITSSSTGDKTYYAKMTPNTYSISYYDGSTKITNLTPTTYKYGTGVTLPTYSKTGYVFEGWYSDSALTKKVTSISKTDIGNKTYYAKMVKSTYSITYYDGATKITGLTPNSYTYTVGATLPTYSKVGYTFNGWYTDKNYTTKVTNISATTTGNKIYYAKTTPNTYKISYYDGDTPLTNLSPTTYTYATGANLPTYSKVGYTFKGWSTSKEGTNIITKISTSDIENKVLYAVFDANEYKVNYVLNGGVNNSKNPQSYVYNSNQFKLLDGSTLSAVATSLKDASKEGYTLQGWYDNENFTGEEITAIATVSAKDQTYYAKWTPNMYTITLDDTIGNTKTIKGIYDSKLQNVEPITRIGYTFDGYATKKGEKYFDANGENTKAWNIAEDTTLYAQWIPNDQTITWIDGNGNVIYSGNAKYDDMPVYDESKYGLPIKDADFESGVGYVFKGWSPEITTVTGDATYTALFEEVDSFDIKYYYGKVLLTGLTPESYKVSVETELPTEIPGYSFDGWYLEDYLKTKIEKISSTTSGDITIYAKPLSVYRDDYVYDNLILHLDGIDHGSVTGIWEDLSKSDNDVILAPNHIVDKKLVETSKTNGVAASSKTKSIIFDEEPDEFTIEIISEFYSDKDGSVAAIKNGDGGIVFNQVNKIQYGPSYQFESKLNTRVHRSITYNKENNTLKVYENGVLLETIESPEVTNIINNKLQLGGLDSDATLNLDGAIYSVRIYDAELTDEQIKQNYETDKERFSSDVDYMKDDLVIYLDGKNKGNTEGIWQDLSGNGNHGTINGATYNGKDGFTFDGINDYVDFGKQHFYEDVTLEALITPNEIDKYRSIFTSQDGGGYALTINSNAIGATSHIGGSYTNMSVDYTNNKKMIHLTYTVGNGYEKLYLDGVLVKAQEITGDIKGPGSLYTKLTLGANNNAAADGSTSTYTEHFYGTIHTARVYKRALTEGEVLENYRLDKEKYNPDKDYVRDGMIIHLDGTNKGNTEGIWQDLSGNNNHGTINGAIYNGKDGFTFDGTDDVVSFDKQHFYENVTIELIFSLGDLTKSGTIFSNLDGAGHHIYYNSNNGWLGGALFYTDGTSQVVTLKRTNGKTIHATYTLDGKYQKSYINGELFESKEITGEIKSPVDESILLALGANPNLSNYSDYFSGNIYATRMYNRALTASEVKQNYNLDKDKYSSDNYVEDDLVIHLDGTNKGDTEGIWQDLSGNGNHGTINGATYNGTNGFRFDGTDDYVKFGEHNYPFITMEVVYKSGTVNQTDVLMANWENAGYGLRIMDNKLCGLVILENSNYQSVEAEYNTKLTSATLTYDGTNIKLYKNGELVHTKAASSNGIPEPFVLTGNYTGDFNLFLGAQGAYNLGSENTVDHFNGEIYGARLYKRALTEEEIKQNYESDKEKYDIEDSDLILHLDGTNKGTTNGVWQDISGNGNHGTINGATYNGVNGFEFDGTDDYVAFDDAHFYENITLEILATPKDLIAGDGEDTDGLFTAQYQGGHKIGFYLPTPTLQGSSRIDNTYYYVRQTPFVNNKTVHVTYTADSSYQRLYVDGVLIEEKEVTGTVEAPADGIKLAIGATHRDNNYVEFFTGTVYDAKLYSRVLTADEVAKNYDDAKEKYGIEDDLIIHLDGTNKGNTEGVWEDLSGNGNHGTINGATYNGTNGFIFDGTDDYVSFDKQHFYKNVTIETLINPKDLTTKSNIIANIDAGGYGLETGTNRIYSAVYIDDEYKFLNYDTTSNKLVHVVYTLDDSYEKLYVDGKLVVSREITGTIVAPKYVTTTLALGANPDISPEDATTLSYSDFFNGDIYMMRMYTRAINENEVKDNYTEVKSKFINDYKIHYYNGSIKLDGIEPSGYEQNESIELGTTEIDGYTLEGWYTSPTFEEDTKKTQVETSDSGDIKVYGKFVPNKYTVSFESNGGSEVESITADYGTEIVLPSTVRENYDFIGWYTSEEFTEEATTDVPLGDATYYAKWEPKTYNINYYSGLIKLDMEPSTYTYSVGTTLPTEVPGYLFDGWYTTQDFAEGTEVTKITDTDSGDKILFAKLSVQEFTISFEENEGTEVTDITGPYGTPVTAPLEPTKENFVFGGWYSDVNLTIPYQFSIIPASDITLYAKWNGIPHSVTWLNADGSEIYTEEVEYGKMPIYDEETYKVPVNTEEVEDGYEYKFIGWDKELTEVTEDISYTASFEKTPLVYNINYYVGGILLSGISPNTYTYGESTILPELNLTGYKSSGWYTSPTFESETQLTEIGATSIGDITVYAKINTDEYTISFEENGGTEVADITKVFEEVVEKPEDPTRENYIFEGWYTEPEFITEYEFTTMPGTDITLYAKWSGVPYKITWLNKDDVEIYSSEVEYGSIPDYDEETYGIPTYEKTGYTYTFKGWDPEVVEVTGEATYKAQYEEVANTYNITYYNGENIIDDLEPNSYTYGVETILPEYVLEGYLFEGWYTSNTFDENTKVEKMTETDIDNKVLYAKVSIQEYTINFDENGGSEVENITSEYESTIELPESTKDGYTFDGWYIDELLENKFELITMPGSDITLYAKWIANEYEITYYNGLVQLEGLIPTTYIHGNEVMLPLYEVEGYTFEGWYTTNTFEENTKVESITETDFGNKQLFAKMVAKQYTITFEENGGNLVEDITADYESEITLPEASRDGYTFEGWYIDEALENKFEADSMPNENITVYAKWVEGVYEISYYKGNIKLEGMMPTSYTYGVGSTLPTEVEGYTLEGWYWAENFEENTKVESITETDFGNKILYANMTINEYTLTFIENDGSEVEDITGEYGTTIELPTTTKEGHTFDGWYTTETFDEGTKFEATTMPGDNLTLYAKWNINVYTITWIDGDGEIIYAEEYEYNQTPVYFEGMGTPIKTSEDLAISYEFKGWSPKIVPVTSNRIYSAQFDEIIAEYEISYLDNDYNSIDLNPKTYIYGTGAELPTYELDGYTFEGWYTTNTFDEGTKVERITETDSGDKELFAKMVAKQYTISFNENGGTLVEDITADYESEITLPIPTLEGHTLEGWYTDENLENKFESTTMPAENTTLYAKWEVTKYTISFEENDGTLVEDIIGEYGTIVTKPVDPTKEGYTFDNWYIDEVLENVYDFTTMPAENITVYAKWNVNEYTINFESNGGSIVESITGNYGTEVTAPNDPTKEGNVFDGWYTDENLENLYTFDTMPAENITLYAKWFTNEYTITFNTLGGSEIEPITKAYGTEITAPDVPTREYSSFVGWYLDSEYTTEFEFTTMPAEDTILYAKWDVEKFTITYANPDGSVIYTEEVEYATTPEYDEVTYGIPTYDKVGYTTVFREWDQEFVMADQDKTYTALYDETVNNYTITYYYGETKLEGLMPTVYTYEVGTELPEYEIEYYTFNGWYTSETFEEDTKLEKISTTDFGDKTLYANMTINQYTISFDSNEGTEVESITADYNSVVEAPVEPTKEGYTFVDWYSDEELNTPYVFTTMPAENITLYAKWNINEYTITFIENGGTEVTDITADYNSVVTKPENPTREHYTFDAWYIDEDLTTPYEFSVMPLNGITLYAKWIGDSHTITWSNIDGTEIYNEQVEYGTLPSYDEETYGVPTYEQDGYTYTFTGWDKEVTEVTGDTTYKATYSEEVNTYNITYYNGAVKLEGIEPSTYVYGIGTELQPYEVLGYTFNGWYTSPTFEEETKVESITTTDFGDKTLYANMVINQYTISFDSNEGTEVESITADYNSVVTKPIAPTKEGYTFDNWYSDEALENVYEFTTMPAENITLYAKWNINEYTITFIENGGTEVEDITADYNSVVTKPENPTREHYTFDAWYIDEDLTTPYEFSVMPLDGITLYARWIGVPHTITWSNIDGTEIYNEQVEYGTLPSYDEETYGVPTYTKDGYTYTFTGWDPEVTEVTGDTTYKATYSEEVNTYNITYYNGAVKLEGIEPSTYVYGIGTELQPYEVLGYTFNGWYTSPTFEEETKVESITATDFGDKTLYANMVINQYTISFDSNEGTEVESITADYNSVVEKPIDPTKEGYTFSGWYTEDTLENEYVFDKMPAEDIILYAKWNINEYTITFIENGGTEVTDITADYNSVVTKPENPTREHYTFDAWYIDEDLTTPYEFSVMPLNGITLYAKWIGVPHTITWSNIDGTEIYNEQVEYGTLPSYDEETYGVPTYTKDGYTYTFTGWDPEVTEVTGDTTYKATYSEEVNTYNITYYYGETKLEGIEPNTYVYGIGTELPLYELEGYRFEGWYTTNTFEENTKVEKISTTDFGDKVLYAKMVRNEFTISFEENGGTEVEDITKTAGEEVTAPTTTRSGYVFEGWYSDIDLTTPYEFSVMPEENITLYAKWNEITIEIVNKDIVMFVDDEKQIEITTTPEDEVLTFNYELSTDIISVSEEGLIKGLTEGDATITVKVVENPNIEEVITVKVHSKEIESETYSVEAKEDVKIIIGMDEGVTIEELINTLSNNKDYINVYDKDGNKLDDYTKVVSTGLNIKLETEDKVYDEVTVILRGDIDGDGTINVTDEAILSEHILFISTIDGYRKYAADIVVDDIIDVTDDSVLTEYILKMISSLN